ncbi:MAG: hypothetical protein HWQ41_23685 [Nostoc sp. NOS(2021)]|uniref:hypothetical protein n=1 Tax=Nostoc sp. NOS(2021) TaxID=2815407 RepID=UPI0025FAB60C|nr:hypothetical protein [Nostoc sp. NOS(2021)]MBN3898162.1 hypothetical protein [Nostoc sp. NOS(2021)]
MLFIAALPLLQVAEPPNGHKVLSSIANGNLKAKLHDTMVNVANYINYIAKSKDTTIDSRSTDRIKEKIKHYLPN